MGGKPRAAAGDAAALVDAVRACPAWDEAREFESRAARQRAWGRQVKAARAAARAIEELARGDHRAELVALLDHPSDDVRADVAAALCGYSTANSGHRRARWGPAGRAELESVAALLGDRWRRTDRWAARALFALDADAAAARVLGELTPEVEAQRYGTQRIRDLIGEIPADRPELDAAVGAAVEWAGDALVWPLIGYLEARAPRQLIAALALDIDDHRFDRLMARLDRVQAPERSAWLVETAALPGVAPARARRLRQLAGVAPADRPPPPLPLTIAAEAGWDGGPMVLLPGAVAAAWEGSFAPSGGRVVDTDHRWNAAGDPATDYDLACASSFGGASLIAAGDGQALVTPTSYAAFATNPSVDGFFIVIQGDDETAARWAGLDDGWRRVGILAIRGGARLQSAALRGGEPGGVSVDVADGRYAIDELAFLDERGEIHLVRARPVKR